MTALVNWLYRTGLKKGSTGGHWSWLVVALGAHILRADKERQRGSVVSMPISPGERVLVTLRDPSDAPQQ